MKLKIGLFCLLTLLIGTARAQLIRGTIRPGNNDSVEIWIKPDFNNTTQYLFQLSFPVAIPASATSSGLAAKLSPAFANAFGSNYSVTVNPVATNTGATEKYFNIVLIRTGASGPQSWTSGAEYKVLAAIFTPSGSPATSVKLADYQDGGSDGQGNFYTMDGNANYYVISNSADNFYASSGQSTTGGNASSGFAQTQGNVPCTPPVLQPINGTTTLPLGQITQLTNSTPGGVWTSDDPGIATVDATGLVTGVTAGSTTVRYKVSNACATTEVTAAITIEQKLIAGSIRKGASNDEIEIWLKPYFTNTSEYLFQLSLPIAFPASVSPQPVIPVIADITIYDSLKTVFGDTYSVSVNPLAQNGTGTEKYFNIVLIRNKPGASASQTWTAGKAFKLLTVKFTNPGGLSQLKLADYQDGGTDGQGNFYTMDGHANYYVTDNSPGNFFAIPGESIVGGVALGGYAQTVSAVAPVCNDPSVPQVSSINLSGAIISWNLVPGAAGYEYSVSANPGLPPSGFSTTLTTYTSSGLLPGTKYYVYIRSACAPGVYSNWVAATFSTTCPATTTATASSVTTNGAIINWGAVAGATGYQVTINTGTPPPGGGNAASGTSYPASGLTPGTVYNIHIRSVCASGEFSAWTTTSFTTAFPPCNPTFIPVVTNITSTAAISWTALGSAVGYEFAVSTSAIPPVSGTPTTATSYTATGLNPSTQYYVHVRVQCGPGRYSPWYTRLFITPCFKPTPFVIANTSLSGTADLGWNKINGALSYEYVVLSNILSPSASLSFTNDTVVHASGLRQGTRYYLHVRTRCALGLSEWSILPFYTAGISVYPNPTDHIVTVMVYGEGVSTGEIELYDVYGKLLKKVRITGSAIDIDMSPYAKGIYLLQFGGTKKYTTRIIKR